MKEEWKKNKWPSINLARFASLSSVTLGMGCTCRVVVFKRPPHNCRTRMILYSVRIATTTVECCSICNPIWNCKLILRCSSVGTCTKNISQSPTWILMALTHNFSSLSVLYTVYLCKGLYIAWFDYYRRTFHIQCTYIYLFMLPYYTYSYSYTQNNIIHSVNVPIRRIGIA